MEELQFPSHLVDALADVKNYQFEYRHNTLLAYTKEHVKVVSDFQDILEDSQAPSQIFSKDWLLSPSKEISEARAFTTGIYTVYKPQTRSMLRGWFVQHSICVFKLDCINKEYRIDFSSEIIAHNVITQNNKDYLVVLTRDRVLSYHDITRERTLLKYQLGDIMPNLNLSTGSIFTWDDRNLIVININNTHLVFIDFKQNKLPLVVEYSLPGLVSIHDIHNTKYILLVSKSEDDEFGDVNFYSFQMFNEDEKSSIRSEENNEDKPEELESHIKWAQIIDSCYIPNTSSLLCLVKNDQGMLVLHSVEINVNGDVVSSKEREVDEMELLRGQTNISNGYIIPDSLVLERDLLHYSVNVELFNSDSIKLYTHEFTSEDSKFRQKSIGELFFNTLKVDRNIEDLVITRDSIDTLTNEEVNDLLFTGQVEEICVELLAYEKSHYKHNLTQVKSFIDRKKCEILDIIDSEATIENFSQGMKYVDSLIKLLISCKERRLIEIEENKLKSNSLISTESETRDLIAIDIDLDSLRLIKQRILYMYLIVKHEVKRHYENFKFAIDKAYHSRVLQKQRRYEKTFDVFTRKYIFSNPLFIQIVLKEAGLDKLYPFKSIESLMNLLAQEMSKETMDFIMMYFLLEIYGNELFDSQLGKVMEDIENWEEYYLYWSIDSSFDYVDMPTDLSSHLSPAFKVLIKNWRTVEYPVEVLQAYHELDAENYYTVYRSSLLKTLENQPIHGLSGNLKDLNNKRSRALTILVHNQCVSGNYSQAQMLLRKAESDSCTPAFVLFCYYQIRNARLENILNICKSESQQDCLRHMLSEEKDIIKYFIDPYFNKNNVDKVKKKKKELSKMLFTEKNYEVNEQFHLYKEYLYTKSKENKHLHVNTDKGM